MEVEIKPLKDTDYAVVKYLFQKIFDQTENKFLYPVWKERRHEASLGIWSAGSLLGAAVVRDHKLEYIFIDINCQGGGIGTQLLQAVLAVSPTLHLTPVNDPRVIRWYESQGFRLSSRHGEELCYARHTYDLRSKTNAPK